MSHRAHDYRHLTMRWRAVAQTAGLKLHTLAVAGAERLFFLRTPALASRGGIYISAGIHGDEPAGSEALITFAEKHARQLARWPLLLFPCLNPWGLRANCRYDADGIDLNRQFHRDDHRVISAVKRATAPHQFDLALMLHEDYDADGFYLYEILRERPYWGEELLRVAGRHLPADARRKIDGRTAIDGLIRRRFDRRRFERLGYPEAIWLHESHARHALTTETPSEFALDQRVLTHVAVIEECMRRGASASGRSWAPLTR